MNIVWFSWKDLSHPEAGGAEKITDVLLSGLARDGHSVTLLTSRPKIMNEPLPETIERNGYTIKRGGGRIGVYFFARRYYIEHLRDATDMTFDECNTLPFMTKFYFKTRAQNIQNYMFFHMLCRDIWFYQLPWFIGWIGWLAEIVYLRLLSSEKVITVSESTSRDLQKYGFKADNISIISEAIEIEPINTLDMVKKYDAPTLLSLGSVRPMKRTLDQVIAFELAKEKVPTLKLIIAGDMTGSYGDALRSFVSKSKFQSDIESLGRVSKEKKIELMQRSHLLLVTSIKEGWGLVVTEANSQGTPAAAYNADGLQDSIRDGETGILCAHTPLALSRAITTALSNPADYEHMRRTGYEWSKTMTNEHCYKDFIKSVETLNLARKE